MDFRTASWNVITVGAWNRAILTPAWIAHSMFRVPAGTALPVEVPINVRAPWKTLHENCGVLVHSSSLEVTAEVADFATLDKARELSLVAIRELDRTPLTAVGVNVRYVSNEGLDPNFAELLSCKLDSRIGDAGFTVSRHDVTKSLPFNNGEINLQIGVNPNEILLNLNFHRSSKVIADLIEWLEMPIWDIETSTSQIIANLDIKIIE